ncbi:MAG: GNAT family N-acetyltransferase [Nocardioidaceae bacterium]|nr:GNAT family N-acetyltransferase [Nocardioidaceae bacterium]
MTVRLVPFADEHVDPMERTIVDDAILRFTGIPVPTPPGWVQLWRKRFIEEDREHWAIVDGEEFAGYAVTGPLDREGLQVELGYAVSPWARGRGIATAALDLLTRWALDAGFLRLTLLIDTENVASQRVAEKAGYTYEGTHRSMPHKNGERVDLQCWSLLPGDLGGPRGQHG